MSTGIWIDSSKVVAACNAYKAARAKRIAAIREKEILALMNEKRWFRRKLTYAEAEAKYILDDCWESIYYIGAYQADRVKDLSLIARVAVANGVSIITLDDRNIKDIGQFLC